MPQNFAPRSILQNEMLLRRPPGKTRPFSKGVFADIPASTVPEGGIADAIGYIPKPHGAEAATGCRAYGTAVLPGLSGRTGYALTKSGATVTKTAGSNFTEADEGNFIVYDDGKHERITDYLSATQVTVENSNAHAASTAAWVRGPRHMTEVHKGTNKLLLHIDTRLFYSDPSTAALFNGYTEIPCISYRGLSNDSSVMVEHLDFVYIINSNGVFKIDMGADNPVYYKVNSPVPETLITAVAKTIDKPYGNKYLYSAARISGTSDIRNRRTDLSTIETETGTCLINDNGIDYGGVFHERPIGDESTTYGVITGGTLLTPYHVSSGWTGITDGQFRISINGDSYNVSADFSDCKTMADVAARIQAPLRTISSYVSVEYDADHFVITNEEEGGTVSFTSVGDGGTDIGASAMKCDSGNGSSDNPNYTQNLTVGDLYMPVDPADETKPQRQYTHYPVYRTLDYGENGVDPVSGDDNNEEQFVWVADVPAAKTIVAGSDTGGCTCTEGYFQEMDVGSKLRFQDGTEVTITAYLSETDVTIDNAGTIANQAAAIGGDNALGKPIRVGTAAQSGTTVTASAGITFSAADVGKTIYWAGGLRSHITAYNSGTGTVTVVESATILSTGISMDPKVRKFNDTIPDSTLRARIGNFSLRQRYWEPLPESDLGVLAPGFFFVATADEKTVYYGHILTGQEHLIGSYNPDQYTSFQDKIKNLSLFPDSLIVYCLHKTEAIPINTYAKIDVNIALSYYKLTGQYTVDYEVGLLGRSLLRKLPDGRDWIITSEPAVRIFDGRSYSPNLAKDRYMKKITELQADGTVFYDPFNGISFFGRVE